MQKEIHILVITDDENSEIVRMLVRQTIIPITRSSILTAMDILRHLEIIAIVIDNEHQNVDSLEFILNAREVAGEIPILVPEKFFQTENISDNKNFENIVVYYNNIVLLKQIVRKILEKHI